MTEAVAIVAGATGLVGQEIIRRLAAEPAWREVRALVRRGLPPELSGQTVVPIPVDYDRLALARATLVQGARHFLLVTSLGASSESRVLYSRVKGEVEASISALGFRSVTIARPSLLIGARSEPRLGEQVGRVLGLLAPPRWRPVSAARVAAALVDAAKRDLPGIRILENRDLQAAPLTAGTG
jgi:uncharacterized protein YbjT (DUF2867 family)